MSQEGACAHPLALASVHAHSIFSTLGPLPLLQITHRDTIREIGETIGAAVVTKGRYCKPGTAPPEGERKLHLHIAGPTPDIVRKAKAEIKRILEESTEKAMRREAPAAGRYSIL